MVKRQVFGVERDVDIDENVYPTPEELIKLGEPLGDHEHGWFDSCIDTAKLHYREFMPPSKNPKAIVIFSNGVTSHSGEAFEKKNGQKTNVGLLAQVFQQADFALYSHDRYGHGFSEGTRFFIPSWESNLQDELTFLKLVDEKHQGKVPIFLMGISYGGCLTIHASRKIQDNPLLGPKKFGGCVLLSPAVVADLPPAPVYFLLRYVLAPMCPKWTPSFMPNPISPERIWKDPEVLKMRRDPRLVEMNVGGAGDPYRLGTALSLVQSLDAVYHKAIPGFQVPFFLMHGTQDHGVKIEGSDYLWETAETPEESRTFKRVEDGYHDLLSLPESYDLIGEVVEWIQTRSTTL